MATARKLIEPLEVHISPMRRRHLRSVLRIESQVYPTPWTHGLFVSEIALRSTRAYVVARVGREVIGYAGLMMSLGDGHVTTIAVDPDWQRQGVGMRLLLALAREAIARGATALTLEVRLSHRGAQQLYQRFGFTAVGVRKGYYADTGEDALDHVGARSRPARVRRAARSPRARCARHDGRRTTEDLVTVRILGIETSCDETAAAVVDDGRNVRSSVVSSQVDLHARYGGVVPEIASRAHVELVNDVISQALLEAGTTLHDVDAVAAAHGPGLAGALLVGVSAAKAIALALACPYVGVNHHEAHMYAALIDDPSLEPPFVTLIVSGGHTLLIAMDEHGRYRVLGRTVDDAAGEAFDKVARFLGLGYPGGPAIDRLAGKGDPRAIAFPRPMLDDGNDFSFSGLKTAVVLYVRKHPDADVADVAASFQAAVVDVLVAKLLRVSRSRPGSPRS